jgi:hypothetical protein
MGPTCCTETSVRNNYYTLSNIRKIGVKNWKQRVKERKKRKEIIEQAKTHK